MGFLYYINTGTSSLWCIAIDMDTGIVPKGANATQIYKGVAGDDFVLDARGYIYLALTYTANALARIDPKGGFTINAGTLKSNSSALVEPTVLQFGRGVTDKRSLYITQNGGNRKPVIGTQSVSRIDIDDVPEFGGYRERLLGGSWR